MVDLDTGLAPLAELPSRAGQDALNESLLDAVRRDDADAVRAWLRQGAALSARDEAGETPMHLAARFGSRELIGLLLEAQAPLHGACSRGCSALDVAVARSDGDGACRSWAGFLLLEQRASLGLAGENTDLTPLHYAARRGLRDVVQCIVHGGNADSAEMLAVDGPTPLALALQYLHADVALLLLDKRALTADEADRGPTPLHMAAAMGAEGLVAVLLARGARLDAGEQRELGPDGTALHVAVVAGTLAPC